MSLRLIRPGIGSANLAGKIHPKTGLELEPIGYLKDGTAVWPVMGGSEDEDDPDFVGGGGGGKGKEDEDDEEEDDDEDEDEPKSRKGKGKHSKDDDDEDEDEEDDKPTRPERQAARYRTQLRAAQKQNADLSARLKALEDKDKPADEIAKREADEAKSKADKLADKIRAQSLELAFFKANQIDWADPSDALRLVDLEDVDVDEDGTVDAVQLRKALRALAKEKPHLVKKKTESSDDDTDDDEPGSRRSAPRMNGRRRGAGKTPTRAELAKKFPVLGR
jgi:hypothetical protein